MTRSRASTPASTPEAVKTCTDQAFKRGLGKVRRPSLQRVAEPPPRRAPDERRRGTIGHVTALQSVADLIAEFAASAGNADEPGGGSHRSRARADLAA